MDNFKQRREAILGVFTKASADLEQLNNEIEEKVQFNQSVIADKMNENRELELLKEDNKSSIKIFAKLLK